MRTRDPQRPSDALDCPVFDVDHGLRVGHRVGDVGAPDVIQDVGDSVPRLALTVAEAARSIGVSERHPPGMLAESGRADG
jgi:hypothetical protein